MSFRPTLVVLAAGHGSRADGTQRRLQQPMAGGSVLGATLRHAIETQLPVVVVTTALLAPLVAGQLATRDMIVVSDAEARRGTAHAFASAVAERASSPGWLMLPGDLPLVRPETLRAVARALEQHAVVFAQYKGRRGHPVGFSAELLSELITLRGDDGLRRVVARYPAHGQEVDDAGVLTEVEVAAEAPAAEPVVAAPGPGLTGPVQA
jgi:molybdenum cofactor cytidylyltransferase